MAARRIEVPGSGKKPVRNARVVSDRPGDEEIVVTIRVRRRDVLLERITGDMTHREYAAQYEASTDDLDRVEAFAKEYGLVVIDRNAANCRITVRGNVSEVQAAFGTHLQTYEATGGRYRGHSGTITVPASLSRIVVGVLGLDTRTPASV